MKITKNYLVKLLKEKANISLSREDRKSLPKLLELCKLHNIPIEQAPLPNELGDIEPMKDETNNDEPTIETNDSQTVVTVEQLDESESMFERLRNSTVNVPRGTNDENNGFSVEVDNEPKPKQRKPRKTKVENEGFNIDGYMLLMLMDMALPTGISYVFNMFEKNPSKKIKAHEICLTTEQQEKMKPLADRAADALTFKMNPITAFAVMGSLMYAQNIFMLKSVK